MMHVVQYQQRGRIILSITFFFVIISTPWKSVNGQVHLELNGDWTIQAEGENEQYPATVPGGVYMALYHNNVISDPYANFNDVNYRWISKKNWIFKKQLNITEEMMDKQHLLLVCNGLDTIANVSINGHIIGNASNMFVRYIFDIKNYVKVGDNELKVSFTSAVTAAKALFDKLPYEVPPSCPPSKQNGECHVNMLRKMQASFSWDWGPAFPDQGIWRDISIESFNSSLIENVKVNTYKGTQGWNLEVEVFFYPYSKALITGKLAIHLSALKIMSTVSLHLSKGDYSKLITIKVPKDIVVKQWWPNGYGTPYLYPLDLIFTSADGQELSAKQIRIGFRTVKLVQNQVTAKPADGLSFYFKVNGIPIFFKGSNWIPADSFQERVTETRIRNLLQSTVDAKQNSIRIWGGGVYESDKFYEVADELGIMIWHDFMFAVALYPTTKDFLNSVEEEITYQVRRLMYHPSIVIWAGNNENELALRSNWFLTSLNFARYKADYVKLYVDTIMPIVKKEDPCRPYVTSSPSNGIQTKKEDWVALNPGDLRFGDIHHYDYIRDLWKDSDIPIPRFSSEYGIQSWPSFASLKSVYNKSEMSYWSKFTIHRQHHIGGQIEMEAEILQHFDIPPLVKNNELGEFQKLIYLTQINQAMAIRFETESYRRHQSQVVEGLGLTMGALYWQLNDIWQGPTWSSLEYDGTWKMLHYFSRKFFAPKLISPYFDDKDVLNVDMVIDGIPVKEKRIVTNYTLSFVPYRQRKAAWSRILSGKLHMRVYKWKNRNPLKTWIKEYHLNKTADTVFQIPLKTIMEESKCPQKSQCFLYFYTKSLMSGPNSWLPLDRFKPASGIPFAKIKVINVTAVPQHKQKRVFAIFLSSNEITPFVWLEAPGISGRFSDNGFLMICKKKVLKFFAWEDIKADQLKNALTVKSLMDVYH